MDYSLEFGNTKSFGDLAKTPDEDLVKLNMRLDLEEKLTELHLSVERELGILQKFDLNTMEGLEALDKKIKKVAMKEWEKKQPDHIAREKEIKKERKMRKELLAQQEKSKREKEEKLEKKMKKEKQKEKENQIVETFWKVTKKRVFLELVDMEREERQRAKALMYVRNIKKDPVHIGPDGRSPNFDWKSAYAEYLDYKKSHKKTEAEKIDEIQEDYKARLEEQRKSRLSNSSYIKQAFREDNYEKFKRELEAKKPRAESPKIHLASLNFEKSCFYQRLEKELAEEKTEKEKQEEKKMRIAQYMAKVRENQAPEISKALQEEQRKRIQQIQKMEKESVHEMIEERRKKAQENQKNYLAELKKESEARGPRKKSEKKVKEEPAPIGPPGGYSRFPNYLSQMRSTPNLVRNSSDMERRKKKKRNQNGLGHYRENLEDPNPIDFMDGKRGQKGDDRFVQSMQEKLDLINDY
jgi:K+-transporting ATPase c subunit